MSRTEIEAEVTRIGHLISDWDLENFWYLADLLDELYTLCDQNGIDVQHYINMCGLPSTDFDAAEGEWAMDKAGRILTGWGADFGFTEIVPNVQWVVTTRLGEVVLEPGDVDDLGRGTPYRDGIREYVNGDLLDLNIPRWTMWSDIPRILADYYGVPVGWIQTRSVEATS